MNPLLFTITFLTLMGILTSSEVVKFTHDSYTHHLFQEHLKTEANKEYEIQLSYFTEYKEQENPNPNPGPIPNPPPDDKEEKPKKPAADPAKSPSPTSLNINPKRPPNNSRLNVYLLLHANDPFHYTTAARLLRTLYGNSPLFTAIPNAELQLLDALLAKKEKTSGFTYPDELASLDLENPTLQRLFTTMLKGGHGYPSLLNYITFDREVTRDKKKINFMFASKELLHAALPDIGEELYALQQAYWEQIAYQEEHKEHWKNRTMLKQELEADLERIDGLERGSCKTYFDLSLSKPGNIIFVEEKATGLTHRTKYIKKHA